MATFRTQIEALVGTHNASGASTENAYIANLNDFLKQSAMAVIDVLPDEALLDDSIYVERNSTASIIVSDKRILKILRANYGCVQAPLERKAFYEANSGSLYEPTKRTPLYYIEGANSVIKPNPTANDVARIYYIAYPSPSASDSSIANFPDSAEYAVVLGASIRTLQSKINDFIHEDEDSELAQIATQELGTLLQLYNDKITRLGGQPTMGVADGSK